MIEKHCVCSLGLPTPFSWRDYLTATDSMAVPDECFSKVLTACMCLLHNGLFKIGQSSMINEHKAQTGWIACL